MADNMQTISPQAGPDSFRRAIETTRAGQAVIVYADEDDPAYHQPTEEDSVSQVAAVLIPADAWNEYATLRNERDNTNNLAATQQKLQVEALQIQLTDARNESRHRAVQLALDTVQSSTNSKASFTAALLKNADDIHKFLTAGTVPEGLSSV